MNETTLAQGIPHEVAGMSRKTRREWYSKNRKALNLAPWSEFNKAYQDANEAGAPIKTPGGMTIVNEAPPEWIMKGCMSQFRVNPLFTFWAYGDVIYNPGGISIPPDIVAHEEQHMAQQAAYKGGKDAWWKEYLATPRFRLEQEAEAYAVQYKWLCKKLKDGNKRVEVLNVLADKLTSPLYQVAISHEQAKEMILVLSGNKRLEG